MALLVPIASVRRRQPHPGHQESSWLSAGTLPGGGETKTRNWNLGDVVVASPATRALPTAPIGYGRMVLPKVKSRLVGSTNLELSHKASVNMNVKLSH